MRKSLIAVGAAVVAIALAGPAAATTLEEVVKHGITIEAGDMSIVVKYTPDGKFTAADGQVTGTWKIDGEKLCTTSNFDPNETCVVYPKDKKPGDSFDLTSAAGTAKVTINK
jgi:hypothetical protein